MRTLIAICILFFASFSEAGKFGSKIRSLTAPKLKGRDTQKIIGPLHETTLHKNPSSSIGPPFSVIGYFDLFTTFIGIGTPIQVFRAIIDISFTDLFVPSLECKGCHENVRYDSSNSSTYEPNGTASELHYMAVSGRGNISVDKVTVAQSVEVLHHPFQELTEWDIQWPWGFAHDSVLGLNMGSPVSVWKNLDGYTTPLPSPFQSMISQGALDKNMFSFKLPSVQGDEGELMFGGYNEDEFEGELSTHPIFPANATQWQIEPNSVMLTAENGTVLMNESLGGSTATLSTAYTFLLFPRCISKMLMEFMPEEARDPDCESCMSCDPLPSLPVLTLNLGGHDFVLTGEEYTVRAVPILCDRECCFPILGANEEKPDSMDVVIGSAFLRTVYSVFDWDTRAVHFGSLK